MQSEASKRSRKALRVFGYFDLAIGSLITLSAAITGNYTPMILGLPLLGLGVYLVRSNK